MKNNKYRKIIVKKVDPETKAEAPMDNTPPIPASYTETLQKNLSRDIVPGVLFNGYRVYNGITNAESATIVSDDSMNIMYGINEEILYDSAMKRSDDSVFRGNKILFENNTNNILRYQAGIITDRFSAVMNNLKNSFIFNVVSALSEADTNIAAKIDINDLITNNFVINGNSYQINFILNSLFPTDIETRRNAIEYGAIQNVVIAAANDFGAGVYNIVKEKIMNVFMYHNPFTHPKTIQFLYGEFEKYFKAMMSDLSYEAIVMYREIETVLESTGMDNGHTLYCNGRDSHYNDF